MRKLNNPCEPITSGDISHLEGKFLTLIEGMGLPEKQESAVKSQIKNILWDSWAEYANRSIFSYGDKVYRVDEDGQVTVADIVTGK